MNETVTEEEAGALGPVEAMGIDLINFIRKADPEDFDLIRHILRSAWDVLDVLERSLVEIPLHLITRYRIINPGPKKVQAITALRSFLGLGLKYARDTLDGYHILTYDPKLNPSVDIDQWKRLLFDLKGLGVVLHPCITLKDKG